MSKWKKLLFATDLHGDRQHAPTVKRLLQFADEFKPDHVVFGGDLFDFRPLRKGASAEERRESMRADITAGNAFLERFFGRSAQSRHYLQGNHCASRDTQLLTADGFVSISEVTQDSLVAQVNQAGNITYSKPLALHKNDNVPTLIEIDGQYTNQMVTHGHDVIVDGKKVKAETLLGQKIRASSIASSGQDITHPEEDDNWIKLLTWVIMDGTVVDYAKYGSPKKVRIQFKLSLEHKIVRLRELLDEIGVPYTFAECRKTGINKLQPYYIRIYGDWGRKIWDGLGHKKQIPSYWQHLCSRNLATFMREVEWTDGHAKDSVLMWCSIEHHNMDTVSSWCARRGVSFKYSVRNRTKPGFSNAKPLYNGVFGYRKVDRDFQYLTIKEVPYGDSVYCVTMPLGTIITRRKGKIAVTGNCARLWEAQDSNDGVTAGYAQDGVRDIEAKLSRLKVKSLPYHKRDGILRIGHLKMLHGFYCGVYAARQHAMTYGSCLFGHVHIIDEHPVPGLERRVARAVGCLCELDMDYNNRNPGTLRQAHGWAYGVINDRTGEYFINQAEEINGQWNVDYL